EGLQKDLDKYLRFYNTERPHQGYKNMGKRPVDTVEKFVKSSRKKAS
ncbi:MAG: IS481 family transposase, partial [Nitrospinota bacterium]